MAMLRNHWYNLGPLLGVILLGSYSISRPAAPATTISGAGHDGQAVRRPDRDLLVAAKRVGPVGDICLMISDRSVLTNREIVTRGEGKHEDSCRDEYCRVDLESTSIVPLTKLNEALRRRRFSLGQVKVAPNGRWLLAAGSDFENDHAHAILAATDGSKVSFVPIGYWMGIDYAFVTVVCWSTRSDTWFEFKPREARGPATELLERRVGERSILRRVPVDPECQEYGTASSLTTIEPVRDDYRSFYVSSAGVIKIRNFKIADKVSVAGYREVRSVKAAQLIHRAVAQLAGKSYWFNQEGEKGKPEVRLYSTDLSTGDVQYLGFISCPVYPVGKDGEVHVHQPIRQLAVSPDGTRLCFNYRGDLYVLNLAP